MHCNQYVNNKCKAFNIARTKYNYISQYTYIRTLVPELQEFIYYIVPYIYSLFLMHNV